MHWQRWSRTGDPTVSRLIRYGTPEKTIAAHTEWRGQCLVWTGAVGGAGYARVTENGTRVLAHRYVWERAFGPIPSGEFIDHACHNRRCLNVRHLRLATPAENTYNRRGRASGRKHDLPRNVYPSNASDGREPSSYYVVISRKRFGGYYRTPEEAAAVAEDARRMMFGAFAGRG